MLCSAVHINCMDRQAAMLTMAVSNRRNVIRNHATSLTSPTRSAVCATNLLPLLAAVTSERNVSNHCHGSQCYTWTFSVLTCQMRPCSSLLCLSKIPVPHTGSAGDFSLSYFASELPVSPAARARLRPCVFWIGTPNIVCMYSCHVLLRFATDVNLK